MHVKYEIVIDPTGEECVTIRVHKKNETVEALISLLDQTQTHETLIGYEDGGCVPLELADVCCFIVEEGHVIALVGEHHYRIRRRLYQLEACLPRDFVKINQSAIANLRQVTRFDTTFGGSLCVHFRNGYRDFVSRRNLRHVKERMGIGK